MDLIDKLLEKCNYPDPKPYLFQVGQKVRILKKVIDDGQTPYFWADSVCEIIKRRSTLFSKRHVYFLRHENSCVEGFLEEELDARYARRINCF